MTYRPEVNLPATGILRGWASALIAAALVLGLGPAGAAVTIPRPLDGTLTVIGHGWGHGIGMSQYGALGGARAGATAEDIVRFYYSNTTVGAIAGDTVRVRVASLGTAIVVRAMSGLAVSWDGSVTTALPTTVGGEGITSWRLSPDPDPTSNRIRLERLMSGSASWFLHAISPGPLAGIRNLSTSAIETSRSGRSVVYRGELRALRTTAGGGLIPVVALPMESYLRSVVPSEMPASWPAAAVEAQAIAARSFAEYLRRYSPAAAGLYDLWDDTRSQVFPGASVAGVRIEQPGSDAAIAKTARKVVLDSGGSVALAQFSSSNGGWTVAGGFPYLSAHADPWDQNSGNPYGRWESAPTVTALEQAFPAIGSFRSVTITARDGNGDFGGRVTTAVVTGTTGSVSVTGDGLRLALGLRSTWFEIIPDPSWPSFPRDVTGDRLPDVLAIVAGTGALRVYPRASATAWLPPVVVETSGWNTPALVASAGAFDEDRISDLVMVMPSGDVMLRRGLAASRFGPPTTIASGWQTMDAIIPIGDFDGDGWADLLTRRGTDGVLLLQRGDGAGGFLGVRQVGTGWSQFTEVLSPGDFSGDGIPDVLARQPNGELWLYPGSGTGGWRSRFRVGTGWQMFTAMTAVGDIDRDGLGGDVLARTSTGELWLYPANGTGGWRPRSRVGTGWQIFSTMLK